MKAYGKHRVTGKEGLTLAGLLMFGKHDAITDAIPQFMIDYREYTLDSERWSDRIYNDATWEGNLYQAYRKILPRVQSFLPVPFKLEGNERVEETKAYKALREAFVNLCVHASYQSDSKLLILKYPDRIVFSNPGTMLVSKEQYFSGGESICRNPALQTMFSMIGAVEKAGSGADTIVQGWGEAKFGSPLISEKSEPNKVELVLPIISSENDGVNGNSNGGGKVNEKVNEKANEKVNEKVNEKALKGIKNIINELALFCQTWKTKTEMAHHVGKSVGYVASHIIPKMLSDGIIEREYPDAPRDPRQRYRRID